MRTLSGVLFLFVRIVPAAVCGPFYCILGFRNHPFPYHDGAPTDLGTVDGAGAKAYHAGHNGLTAGMADCANTAPRTLLYDGGKDVRTNAGTAGSDTGRQGSSPQSYE